MKLLNSYKKNFDKSLDALLFKRKKKIQFDTTSVTNIIKDVKKNGDKALIKYEKHHLECKRKINFKIFRKK